MELFGNTSAIELVNVGRRLSKLFQLVFVARVNGITCLLKPMLLIDRVGWTVVLLTWGLAQYGSWALLTCSSHLRNGPGRESLRQGSD